MQPVQPLLKLWRKWFNRNKLFKIDEMNELESHLLDEIDYIKEHDKLSEEQAFQKAVQLIGQREPLDKEYDKNHGFTYPKFVFWFRNHTLQLLIASLLIIVFLVADFQFSQKHTLDTKIGTDYITSSMEPIFSIDKSSAFKISYVIFDKHYTKTIQWNVNQKVTKSSPLFFSQIHVFDKEYLLILDDQKQLWMEDSETFSPESYCFKLETNTDWLQKRNLYKKEIIKEGNITSFNFNNKPFEDHYSLGIADSYSTFLKIYNNSQDLNIFTLGPKNSVLNNFLFFRTDQSKIYCTEVLYHEFDICSPDKFNIFGIGKNETKIIIPQLNIRSYQLERRPLHILPYLFNKVKVRFIKSKQL